MNKRQTKKRLSPNREQYKRQLKRIERIAKRLILKGEDIDLSLLPKELPKRVTQKRLSTLQSINAKNYLQWQQQLLEIEAKKNYKMQQEISKENIEKYPENLAQVPDLSIVDTIRQGINDLSETRYTRGSGKAYEIPISVRKNTLLNILDNALVENDEYLNEYVQHLLSNQEQIFACLNRIQYTSKDEEIDNSFIELANILNWGIISESLAEDMSSMSEYL